MFPRGLGRARTHLPVRKKTWWEIECLRAGQNRRLDPVQEEIQVRKTAATGIKARLLARLRPRRLIRQLPGRGGSLVLHGWGIFGRSTVLSFEYHGVWPGLWRPEIQNVAKVRQVLAGPVSSGTFGSEHVSNTNTVTTSRHY